MKMYIDELQCRASVGVFSWEKQVKQQLIINLDIDLLNPFATMTDDIDATLNYKTLSKEIVSYVQSQHFGLIERVAYQLCQLVLDHDSRVIQVTVEVNKPGALRLSKNVRVSQSLVRNQAIIGIGSNQQAKLYIEKARQALNREFHLLAYSQDLQTKAIARENEPDFINTAVLLTTSLSKSSLVRRLKHIEWELGKKSSKDSYGVRTIDLDLLLWNQVIEDADILTRVFLQESIEELLPGVLPLISTKHKIS